IVPIGVTSPKRSESAPDIPALSENPVFKDVNVGLWFALLGPPGLPQPIVAKLRAALDEIVNDSAFQKEYQRTGGTVMTGVSDMDAFLRSDREKFKRVVDIAHIGKK